MYKLLLGVLLFASTLISTPVPDRVRFSQSELWFLKEDGTSWDQIPIFQHINKTTYVTAAARHPRDTNRALIGTSFEGIYETLDMGKTWRFVSESRIFTKLFQGAGFYDEVSNIEYASDNSFDFYFEIGHGGGTYLFNRSTSRISDATHTFSSRQATPAGFFANPEPPVPSANNDQASRQARRLRASNRTGIFINPNLAGSSNYIQRLDMLLRNGMNSVVIDFKDDQGLITYDSQLPLVQQTRARSVRFRAADVIKAAHDRGVYVIARIVVFKDKQLWGYNNNAYALWDRVSNRAWGVFRTSTPEPTESNPNPSPVTTQIEHWVDPYSDFVHQYNIAIAKELEALGVDEIQFDYIRFPSDGNTRNIQARFHRYPDGSIYTTETGFDRVHALSNFLSKAREAISIPISTDVFGFNGWTRMSYLGQDIQAISRYVDVISPMAYPSHYATSFLPHLSYFDRASHLYNEGTRRARRIVEDRVLIRPYVQAFLLGSERNYNEARYFDYLNRQVRGSIQGGASGFTLWNQLGNYYMIDQRNFKTMLGE